MLCCYIMVNKRTSRLVVVMDELDSTIKDVAFECIVLNRYGKFEKVAPYLYLHANVIDLHGFTTITMTIGGVLINFHLDKFVKGKHLRIKNFFMRTHANFEKGDLNVSLKVTSSIVVDTLDDVDVQLCFLHINLIASFIQQIHKKWAIATLVVVVICLQGKVDGRLELIVVDGDSPSDIQTVQTQ